MEFEPFGMQEEGMNFGMIAFKQYLTYGWYKGECTINGEKVEFEKVFGHIEHVFSRW